MAGKDLEMSSSPEGFADGAYHERKSEYRSSAALNRDQVTVSGEYTNFDFDDETLDDKNTDGTNSGKNRNKFHKLWKSLTKGGTVFDGFLLAASQEVGQVILTLPYIFSMVGMKSGIVLQFVFAGAALYTNSLLVNLHTEFRKRLKDDPSDPRSSDPHYVVSYHDIIGGLIGEKARIFTFGVVFFALLGLTTVQIIATSSNFYILYNGLTKRTWSIIWGVLFSLVAFVPNFRHYRLLAVIGILTTTYVSWYMTIEAAAIGPDDDVVYDGPLDAEEWFRGMVSLLFVFGGHASNIEVADVMDDHATYDQSYFYSFLYVFTLTLPNAISAYRTFGGVSRYNPNSFNMYPQSMARDFGIVMMSLHQLVAFGLFIGPVFHIWEHFLDIHNKRFSTRVLYRLPLCGCVLLIAVAFPFFGAINSVLGAFTTSFSTYIIPLVAFNLVFRTEHDTAGMAKPLPQWANLRWVRLCNWCLAGILFVFGVGVGGWASLSNFWKQIEYFDYFAECYLCDAPN
jgi:auxin influx carrier (AUX1 LAX family)